MRRRRTIVMAIGIMVLLCACGIKKENNAPNNVGMVNPWKSFDSLKNAEEAAGFSFNLPEVVEDTYKAKEFGVMSGDSIILEVVYQGDGHEVIVRKSQGEGQDISGVYTIDEVPDAMLETIDCGGYSWSIYAPNGLDDDDFEEFIEEIID